MLRNAILSLSAALAAKALPAPPHQHHAPPGVPSYVTKYAPILHLYSTDPYRPADISSHLDFTTVPGAPNPLTLHNLNKLNALGGKDEDVYLTATKSIKHDPAWLHGVQPNSHGPTPGAVSCAIIVNDHGAGLVNVFYMYFYAFDFGGVYFDLNIGNHVGDWEHNMLRFQDGVPQAVWYSQHANGEAFAFDVTEKIPGGKRPVVYSANGTHANYAIRGVHAHEIPNENLEAGIIEDQTDRGPVWDPTLSAYYYRYESKTSTFSAYDDSTPVNWLYFTGHWGDKKYPGSRSPQDCFLGVGKLCKYTNGPKGPLSKHLNRREVCPDNGMECIVRTELGP